jgi:putative tryptophan/tyrosine transport system substrate-binding protein
MALVSCAAVTRPLSALAQQPERMRRVGVLMPLAADDPEAPVNLEAFLRVLRQLGWTVGRNIHIDTRWGSGNADNIQKYAGELVALRQKSSSALGECP